MVSAVISDSWISVTLPRPIFLDDCVIWLTFCSSVLIRVRLCGRAEKML